MSRRIEHNSRDGITIGMIDAIISLATALNERLEKERERLDMSGRDFAWHTVPVQNALLDLKGNVEVQRLLFPRDEKAYEVLRGFAQLEMERKQAT